jgi:hypothetical protein
MSGHHVLSYIRSLVAGIVESVYYRSLIGYNAPCNMSSQPTPKKKVLFLYYELAGYVVACLEQLATAFSC